jgi:putative transposase
MRYRRARLAGGGCFFTDNLAERSRVLLVDTIEILRNVVRAVRQNHPFDMLAWVVFPDHARAIWELPEGDGDKRDAMDADHQWRRPVKAHGLRAFQSDQTWICETCFGLALQFDTPLHPARMDA